MKKIKNDVEMVYRIYQNKDGLLKIPIESMGSMGFGYDEPYYKDFKSIEDAIYFLKRDKAMFIEFIVVPVLKVDAKDKDYY